MWGPAVGSLGRFSREPKCKGLRASWLAFFVISLVRFNRAPLWAAVWNTFALRKARVVALPIMKVAPTVPGRAMCPLRNIAVEPASGNATVLDESHTQAVPTQVKNGSVWLDLSAFAVKCDLAHRNMDVAFAP